MTSLLLLVSLAQAEDQQGQWMDEGTVLEERSYVLNRTEADTVAGWLEERKILLAEVEQLQELGLVNDLIIKAYEDRVQLKDAMLQDHLAYEASLEERLGVTEPAFYQRPWFLGVVISGAVLGAGYGIDRLVD